MTDIRPEQRIFASQDEGIAEELCGKVDRWMHRRDVTYRNKWLEFERIWKGEWAPQDRDRTSERSKAIMPATAQAVDSAVSEVEEAMFGRERWFDVDSDDPATRQDEGQVGRQIADNLLRDMRGMKSEVSKCSLLAAVLGTGIGKIVVDDAPNGQVVQHLVAVHPLEFVIDPAAETIEEAEGVAHVCYLPKNLILQRQREGRYVQIDPGSAPDTAETHLKDASAMESDTVRIIEYQGQVPAKWVRDAEGNKLPYEDDAPVEAVVTIANNNVVLRIDPNPWGRDRGFVAFQWDTVPGHFWGRGVVEKAFWPQKVLDAEIRSRIDALAYSVAPMMSVNAAMVPRGGDFSVRPGRNVFFNGNPAEAVAPLQFPPPDPQTYTQSQEMQRQIEMATGQLQAATPFQNNGRNETASGMSMMLGASIRRTRRTMANIERQFMQPLIQKVLTRFQTFDEMRYPSVPVALKIHGTLGMMARELEQMQLGQMLNAMPPGAPQLMILRAAVDNMSLVDRQGMMNLLDMLLRQAMQPKQPERDLGGEARLMSAQTRAQEVQQNGQIEARKLAIEETRLQLDAADKQRNHERGVLAISVDADKAESAEVKAVSESILNVAKAEAEELGQQLEKYRAVVDAIKTGSNGAQPAGQVDLSAIQDALAAIQARLDAPPAPAPVSTTPIRIDRNAEGLVTGINGRTVQRDANGLMSGVT